MAEQRAMVSFEGIERALATLGPEIVFPPSPPLAPRVVSRLVAERQRGARPPLPQLAVWPRRSVLLALAALGVLLLAGAAVAARLALGAIEIRVLPTLPRPTPTAVESGPSFGTQVSLSEAQEQASFRVVTPPGPGAPDAVYVDQSTFGVRVVLAWRPARHLPTIPRTRWGLILMELRSRGGAALAVKEVGADLARVRPAHVGGREAFWITGPHALNLPSPTGQPEFLVNGNVLIWTRGDVTLRMESTLPEREAIALAESIG